MIHIERLAMPVLADLVYTLEEAKEGIWRRIVLLNASHYTNRCQSDYRLAHRFEIRDPFS